MIHVGLVTYSLDPSLLVTSLAGRDVTFHLYTHSSNRDVLRSVYQLRADLPNIILHDYQQNRGLATSWNDTLVDAYGARADCVILANDDLVMTRADLDVLARGCVEHPECGAVVCNGYNVRMDRQQDLGFAVIGINPVALETTGYFDENFSPIYFEDSDWSRRSAIVGMKWHNAGDTGIVHLGSETQKVPELHAQNDRTFAANYAYFLSKHGGSPSDEKYQYPFNDRTLSWHIPAAERHNPYPAYARTDKDIVQL